ncbi:uncharacterized protein F5147DRAFT_747684 [Suillus discolor]|uniref:Uncharacterized protein n=1 Tax=Suillus discolor TaxID=1912936 RepID=A0A9P7EWU7_9AGAM|nr:uncharacterized protein F5147DRAFT_747684 [Suillus discolor]KAG2095674.1 hypothetical protein F5147DRAFT_747684 [Suillus discolor]
MTVESLRATLRKGNPRPSPGPDNWEKCNFLLNIPFTWLNSLLIPYLARLRVLPKGQVATQLGVQGRDLTSFLSQLECWSNRHHTPLFLLRRDQQKGFDKLEPQGFYDAITAYVTVSSIQHMDHREHVPADRLSLALAMCEATDDSLLFAGSLPSLERSCLAMERFQAAYGWLTNWDKSAVFVLNVPDPPMSLSLPSVWPADPTSPTVCMRSVRVITSHVEFLRVSVNDPLTQFAKIRDIIVSFSFPRMHCQLPLTALRRIISQCLVSRIRPLLAFQPVTRIQAQQLDHMIARHVHDYYRFPFHFNSTLLSLPTDLFGMGFPSISRLNDTLALQVTAATGSLVGSLDNYANGATILHGEVYGLIVSALLARSGGVPNTTIHSDHLNAVRIMESSIVSPLLPHSWSTLPTCSLYRWLSSILSSSSNPPTLSHIKAHTTSSSLPAQANVIVDTFARDSHTRLIRPYPVPSATFTLNTFSLYSSTSKFIDTLALPLYDSHAPPEHPYVRTPYAFAALVQLYARVFFTRLQNTSPWCRFGCKCLETPHHLFVQCFLDSEADR